MRISQGKKSTASVMCHQGYGGVIIIKNSKKVFIPKEAIFQSTGRIKKYALEEAEHFFNGGNNKSNEQSEKRETDIYYVGCC